MRSYSIIKKKRFPSLLFDFFLRIPLSSAPSDCFLLRKNYWQCVVWLLKYQTEIYWISWLAPVPCWLNKGTPQTLTQAEDTSSSFRCPGICWWGRHRCVIATLTQTHSVTSLNSTGDMGLSPTLLVQFLSKYQLFSSPGLWGWHWALGLRSVAPCTFYVCLGSCDLI